MFRLDLAHSLHKMFALHLELYAAGSERHDYDVAAVADPAACDLGRWMRANQMPLSALAHFGGLQGAHTAFHVAAARLAGRQPDGSGAHAVEPLVDPLRSASASLSESLAALAEDCRSHPEFRFWDVAVHLDPAPDAFRFDQSMRIGVPVIDSQHELIAATASQLLRYPTERLTSESVHELLVQLQKLLVQHFATEEMFMRSVPMPGSIVAAHAAEHSRIVGLLSQWQLDTLMRFNRVVADIVKDIHWMVVEHVLGFDLQLAQHFR